MASEQKCSDCVCVGGNLSKQILSTRTADLSVSNSLMGSFCFLND